MQVVAIVIEKLEEVRKNQHLLYEELQNISYGINRMEEKLNDINNHVEELDNNITNASAMIDQKLNEINYNTAVTAYYAEKTAQYSKRQNELTNTLGYLIAFK